jgi:hypothetical protein
MAGGRTLFYRNNRLYQIEGTASSAGERSEFDAMRFHQSLDLMRIGEVGRYPFLPCACLGAKSCSSLSAP